MLFKTPITVCLTTFIGLTFAAAFKQKRDVVASTLYAYGTDIAGEVVFFVDGLAYIGNSKPDFGKVATNITLSADSDDANAPWTAIASNSTTNSTIVNGASLYIITTPGSIAPVGFVPQGAEVPTGAVTNGFTWFGTQAAYISDDQLEMQFWAVATNETGIWSLVWNADGELIENATPVNLKNTAPIILTLDDA